MACWLLPYLLWGSEQQASKQVAMSQTSAQAWGLNIKLTATYASISGTHTLLVPKYPSRYPQAVGTHIPIIGTHNIHHWYPCIPHWYTQIVGTHAPIIGTHTSLVPTHPSVVPIHLWYPHIHLWYPRIVDPHTSLAGTHTPIAGTHNSCPSLGDIKTPPTSIRVGLSPVAIL